LRKKVVETYTKSTKRALTEELVDTKVTIMVSLLTLLLEPRKNSTGEEAIRTDSIAQILTRSQLARRVLMLPLKKAIWKV
jgi:hypothetical protein